MQFHFISGLPRSGSTLLAGILRQNPDMHASMSSPLAGLINSVLEQTGAATEFYPFFDDERRMKIINAMMRAYYYDVGNKQTIFDTNRLWTARMHQLEELFGDHKVICCVRNPAWIADSFEVLYRKNPFDYSRMFNASDRINVYTRCETVMAASGVVGSAWTALKEAFYGEFSERLILVDYDILAQKPKETLDLLYQFLNLPAFEHDFDNLNYQQTDFDDHLGIKGLHNVRPSVSLKPRRSVLPPDLFKQYQEMAFWHDVTGTNCSVIQARQELKN